jgi:hypothetical protein
MRLNFLFMVLFHGLTDLERLAACNMHPGMTHEQWTSAIAVENNKNGTVKTFSDNFWSATTQIDNREQVPGQDRRLREDGRRIRTFK